jgi:hypothetical protein
MTGISLKIVKIGVTETIAGLLGTLVVKGTHPNGVGKVTTSIGRLKGKVMINLNGLLLLNGRINVLDVIRQVIRFAFVRMLGAMFVVKEGIHRKIALRGDIGTGMTTKVGVVVIVGVVEVEVTVVGVLCIG